MKRMTLVRLFGKTAAAQKTCPCCGGVGEHATGFECYLCDSGGTVPEGTADDATCDGRYNDGGPSHNFGGLGPEGIMCVYPHPSGRRTAGEYHEPPMQFEGVKTWTQARQYGAEDRMSTQLPEHPIGSVEEAQKIADKVTNRAKVRRVTVQHTPGRNYSFAQVHPEHGTPRIVLGDGGMNHSTLLHELAHHIDREKGTQDPEEPHDDSFRGHFEQVLVDHHPNSYVAREAFRDKFQQTDQVMRMGGRARSGPNPEMNEREKAEPPVPAHKPMWEHDPETLAKARNAVEYRSEPHTYRKYMHHYPELDYESDDDYERESAHIADEDLEKGLRPRLVPPHMLEAWVKHHPNPKALEDPEYDDEGEEVPVRHTGARQRYTEDLGDGPSESVDLSNLSPRKAAEDPDDPGLIHRGLTVILPEHIHRFVHDEKQPAPARAQMLLAHVRKAKPEITSEEAKGTTGGLGNFWSPRKEKAAEYGDQGGWKVYHDHEREHGCGDPETGYGGCKSTHVILHAGTPPEKHHWTEVFRDGEHYDPEVSWRLPVRPDAKLMVHGISWKQGHDNEHSSDRDYTQEKAEPYRRYDFLRPMRKRAGANGDLPEGLTFSHREQGGMHTVLAHPGGNRDYSVGSMTWHAHERSGPDPEDGWCETCGDEYPIGHHKHPAGEVEGIQVMKDHRRRGIASALWDYARSLDVHPKPVHSADQTEEGSAWARTTAAYVPPGTMGTDSQGHQVQMTTMDGWAHQDGSHGHEDNSTINDHPVYTHDHTWLPEGRYWGPNSAQNDQRLFNGDHLRPEVRRYILDRVGSYLRQYGEWRRWTKVYFLGSEAAKWVPFNGDTDIILGMDFDAFRDENVQYEEMDDAEIASSLTSSMWKLLNVSGHYFTLADGQRVGPFDVTYFLNPEAWDIRKLHPYAAYDVTDDDWAVHPLEVPSDWDARRLPESYWDYAESLVAEIRAIGELPAEERHRMAANLFQELHSHRADAFGDEGKGIYDLSNVIMKYLEAAPGNPWAQLQGWANESSTGPEPWVPTTARRTTLTDLLAPRTADGGADYGGVMIALVPPKRICKKLVQEGGEPLDAMHVTLAYMPGQDRRRAARVLPDLVRGWARTQKPLRGNIGGVGTFVNPGSHVLWAAVDIPDGGVFRESLVEVLERHGFEVAKDHGWTPHLTLAYSDRHFRFMPKVQPESWSIDEVHVCVGDRWEAVPLG